MYKVSQIILFVLLLNVNGIASAHEESAHIQSLNVQSAHIGNLDEGSVTYLGNEAIMVELAQKKVIFDPFFHNDFGVYQLVPDAIKSKIHQGVAPFDKISLILISHAHADHFAADEVLNYMQKHQQVSLIGPKQAVQALLKLAPSNDVSQRFYPLSLSLKQKAVETEIDGVLIEAVRIPHAGWPSRSEIENMVYRVSLSGRTNKQSNKTPNELVTVIHMGDADPNINHYLPHKRHWASRTTDIAFPPYWFYSSEEGRSILTETLNAHSAIGLHVPMLVPQDLKQSGFDYFSVPGEQRIFNNKQKFIKGMQNEHKH